MLDLSKKDFEDDGSQRYLIIQPVIKYFQILYC